MKRMNGIGAAVVAATLSMLSGVAEAQWVMLARHVVGRVEQMSQTSPVGASYDVAAVIVDVAPDKVFDTVKRRFAASTEAKVTRTDDARRSIEFTDGSQIGGIQVSALGDGLSQLMVSTAHPGVRTSTTATIVERILAVCRELNVSCQKPQS